MDTGSPGSSGVRPDADDFADRPELLAFCAGTGEAHKRSGSASPSPRVVLSGFRRVLDSTLALTQNVPERCLLGAQPPGSLHHREPSTGSLEPPRLGPPSSSCFNVAIAFVGNVGLVRGIDGGEQGAVVPKVRCRKTKGRLPDVQGHFIVRRASLFNPHPRNVDCHDHDHQEHPPGPRRPQPAQARSGAHSVCPERRDADEGQPST